MSISGTSWKRCPAVALGPKGPQAPYCCPTLLNHLGKMCRPTVSSFPEKPTDLLSHGNDQLDLSSLGTLREETRHCCVPSDKLLTCSEPLPAEAERQPYPVLLHQDEETCSSKPTSPCPGGHSALRTEFLLHVCVLYAGAWGGSGWGWHSQQIPTQTHFHHVYQQSSQHLLNSGLRLGKQRAIFSNTDVKRLPHQQVLDESIND